ncbi:MAG: hypothetical protein QXT28_08640 [Thermofilaceae archaeon]
MLSCKELSEMIRRLGYRVHRVHEDDNFCIIDFRHPKVRVEMPVPWFLSSVLMNKRDGSIKVTVRSRLDGFKELYLDYCCENGTNVCWPRVDPEEMIISVEATFRERPVEKLRALLSEIF